MAWMPCPHCDEKIDVFGTGGGQTVADGLSRILGTRVPLLGQVPIDLRLREGGDNGKPLVLTDPDAPAATELRRIAAALSKKQTSLKGLKLNLSPTTH
jgi:ATP-binding protein involved in chromosome partitioning